MFMFKLCYGGLCSPQIQMLKSLLPVFQDVTILGHTGFKEVVKVKRGHQVALHM